MKLNHPTRVSEVRDLFVIYTVSFFARLLLALSFLIQFSNFQNIIVVIIIKKSVKIPKEKNLGTNLERGVN